MKKASRSGPRKGKGETPMETNTASVKHPSVLRRRSMKIDELKGYLRWAEDCATELRAIIVEMERLGFTELDTVDGVTKFSRGQKMIAAFLKNVQRSVIDQRFGR